MIAYGFTGSDRRTFLYSISAFSYWPDLKSRSALFKLRCILAFDEQLAQQRSSNIATTTVGILRTSHRKLFMEIGMWRRGFAFGPNEDEKNEEKWQKRKNEE